MTDNLPSGVERSERPRSSAWLWPLLPIAIATFALSALVAYQLHGDNRQAQSFLQRLVIGIYGFAGFVPSFFFFLLMLSWSSIWFLTGKIERPFQRVLRLAGLTLALAIWVNLQPDGAEPSPAAGQLGSWLGSRLVSLLGHFFSVVLVAPLTLGALLLATDFFFYRFFEGMHARLDQFGPQPSEGVEAQVTEHLKGLSQVIAQPAATPSAAASDESAAPTSAVDAMVDEDLDEEPIVLRRMSSFERRQRALAAEGVDPALEGSDAASSTAVPAEASASATEGEPLGAGVVDSEESPRTADDHELSTVVAVDRIAPGDVQDVGDDLAIAAAVSAEPVSNAQSVRRGRLAPIVAGEDASEEEPADRDSDTEWAPPAAPASPIEASERDVVAPAGMEASVDSDVTPEPEAPADESLRAEPIAELAPADEVATAADAIPASAAASELGDVQEPLVAASPEADEDHDYFATVADEPPEVEPIIELESPRAASAAAAVVPAMADATPTADVEAVEEALAESAAMTGEPVIPIPRPPEGVRQQRLFVGVVDDSLVRDAIEIVTATRRASATHLQRKLRVDYEQAIELLQVLAHRGLIELAEGESQGRVR